MDRQISSSEQRRRQSRTIIRWGLVVAAIIAVIFSLRFFIRPSADTQGLRIAKVERGDIKNTVTATGLVIATFEEQLNAPVATTIEQLHLPVGAEVAPGDLVVSLDREYVKLSLDGRRDQLMLKQNNVDLLKLEYDRDIQELEYNTKIKTLELSTAEAQLADTKRLLEVGGATAEEVEQAELSVQIIGLERDKLQNELNYRKSSLAGRRRNLELEVGMEEKEVAQLSRKLRETEVRAPRAGVITWINENIGQQVTEGAPLVRIADLGKFRMEASCSDRYADQIQLGMPVDINLAKAKLTGKISSILPEVENNTLKFLVAFDEPNHDALRPSLRAEVEVVAGEKPGVLRVRNGPTFRGGIRQQVYVVRGEEAIATEVRLGMRNGEFIEITEGLQAGDQVIISDTQDFQDRKRISLK